MTGQEKSSRLRRWLELKQELGLSDAHVQMARELRLGPGRLARRPATQVPLSQHIEELYLKRFKHAVPEPAPPLRQLLHEAMTRERAAARERRRRRRRSELDHAAAARISLRNLWRLCNAVGLEGFSLPTEPMDRSEEATE